MKRVWSIVTISAALLGACGGNYSNEDLDFQTALPDDRALEAQLPQRAVVADPAPLYNATRDVMLVFNGTVRRVLALVDFVRRHEPTVRRPAQRVWGPFPMEDKPGWHLRVTMAKIPSMTGAPDTFQYAFEVTRSPSAGPWFSTLTGTFRPGVGGAGAGAGRFHIETAAARAAGYPDDPPRPGETPDPLDTLDVDYDLTGAPRMIALDLRLVRGATVAYTYAANADGSGSITFTWPGEAGNSSAEEVLVMSRWLATGAGRADATVTRGTATGTTWTECWGPDARATYVKQGWLLGRTQGDPAACPPL